MLPGREWYRFPICWSARNRKKNSVTIFLPGVEQISFGLLGGQNVEVKAVLSFDALIRTRTQQKVLREVELTPFTREEMERRPGNSWAIS